MKCFQSLPIKLQSFIQDVSLNLDKSYMDNPDNTTL